MVSRYEITNIKFHQLELQHNIILYHLLLNFNKKKINFNNIAIILYYSY